MTGPAEPAPPLHATRRYALPRLLRISVALVPGLLALATSWPTGRFEFSVFGLCLLAAALAVDEIRLAAAPRKGFAGRVTATATVVHQEETRWLRRTFGSKTRERHWLLLSPDRAHHTDPPTWAMEVDPSVATGVSPGTMLEVFGELKPKGRALMANEARGLEIWGSINEPPDPGAAP